MLTEVVELMIAGVHTAGLVVEACTARKYKPVAAMPETCAGMV